MPQQSALSFSVPLGATSMPLTKKGKRILRSMRKQYGSEEKAKSVFYASINSGRIKGAHKTDARRGGKRSEDSHAISSPSAGHITDVAAGPASAAAADAQHRDLGHADRPGHDGPGQRTAAAQRPADPQLQAHLLRPPAADLSDAGKRGDKPGDDEPGDDKPGDAEPGDDEDDLELEEATADQEAHMDEDISDAGSSSAHRALMEELKKPRNGAAWKDPENAEHVSNYEALARSAHEVHRFSRSRASSMLLELQHARARLDGFSDVGWSEEAREAARLARAAAKKHEEAERQYTNEFEASQRPLRSPEEWEEMRKKDPAGTMALMRQAPHGTIEAWRQHVGLSRVHGSRRDSEGIIDMEPLPCPECGGTGLLDGVPCGACQGSGWGHEFTGTGDYQPPFKDASYDREFSSEQRKKAASKGEAMKGGGYPIKSKGDLKNAIQAIGRAKNRAATIKHIKKRAKALGASEMIPSKWGDDNAVSFSVLGDVDENVPLFVRDGLIIDQASNVHFTDDGYLAANPRIARTGIQIYSGDEVGKPELERVRVYRPEAEVFAADTVASYSHLPVTDDHPKQMLSPKNWAKYVKGETGDEILRDGKSVRIPMMLRDHDSIQKFKDGKNQLSVGYVCDLDWTAGRTSDGYDYDCIQRNIRANHLAVVGAARGGPELNIGDRSPNTNQDSFLDEGESKMTLKAVQIDGITVEMTDTAAQVMNQVLARMQAQIDAFKKKEEDDEDECEDAKSKLDAANTVLKTKDAEIATLKQQLRDAEMTPVKLDGLVKERGNVIDKARKAMGSSLVVDGRTIEDIRRQVVEARLGSAANGWGDGEIRASFDTLTAGKASSPIQDAVTAFGRPGFVDVDPRQAAYDEYDREMANAWRGSQAKTA